MDVIVVDDEYPLRAALRRALALEGYGVTEAASGEEAIELLRDRTWDAMILDVLMPGLSGLEVCERLRAAGERIPILMLTARETVADRVRGLEAGADDYLVKPFALEELLARLRALMRRSTPADEEEETLRYEGLVLDPVRYEVRVGAARAGADPHRVLAPAPADAPPGQGALADHDQRAGLGL